jgi:hypothetical protein
MKRQHCPDCKRETFDSLPLDIPLARMEAACDRNDRIVNGGRRDCATFTAGRRAGLKEALKLAKADACFMGNDVFNEVVWVRHLSNAIRKAMKPARVKA